MLQEKSFVPKGARQFSLQSQYNDRPNCVNCSRSIQKYTKYQDDLVIL